MTGEIGETNSGPTSMAFKASLNVIGESLMEKIRMANQMYRFDGLETPEIWQFDIDPASGVVIADEVIEEGPEAMIMPVRHVDIGRVLFLGLKYTDEDGEMSSERNGYTFHFDRGHTLEGVKSIELMSLRDPEPEEITESLQEFTGQIESNLFLNDFSDLELVKATLDNLRPKRGDASDMLLQLLAKLGL